MLLISLMPLSAFAVEDAVYDGTPVGAQPEYSHEGRTAWGDNVTSKGAAKSVFLNGGRKIVVISKKKNAGGAKAE